MLREKHRLACKKWRSENKAKISEYNTKYWATHREERAIYNKEYCTAHKEKYRLYSKKWKASNKVKISEYNKKYSDANKEELAEYHKEYYQKNKQVWKKHQSSSVYKEYQRVYQSQRRKDLKDRGSYFPKDIKDLYASQGGSCYYCRIDIEGGFHIDHMVPLSRNGRNDVSNICLACVPCNLQKHTKTAEEFMNEHKSIQGDNYVRI